MPCSPVIHLLLCTRAPCPTLQVPKEWYYYPHGYQPEGTQPATPTTPASANGAAAPDAPHPVDEAGRAGPITKDEVKQLVFKGVITPTTHLWAAGMPQPRQFNDIRELRWMSAKGGGLLGPFDAALVALQLLQQLAALQPAVDEQGCVLTPLPRVHRELAAPTTLPHLVQVMLTGEWCADRSPGGVCDQYWAGLGWLSDLLGVNGGKGQSSPGWQAAGWPAAGEV